MNAAIQALYALLQSVWPAGATLLHPDHATTFQKALEANQVVVRYYQPQLLRTGGIARYLCTVDIATRTAATGALEADKLLTAIGSTPARDPKGLLEPRAVHIDEESYSRMNLSFVLLVDTLP